MFLLLFIMFLFKLVNLCAILKDKNLKTECLIMSTTALMIDGFKYFATILRNRVVCVTSAEVILYFSTRKKFIAVFVTCSAYSEKFSSTSKEFMGYKKYQDDCLWRKLPYNI